MLELNNNSLYREVIMEHYKNPKNSGLVTDVPTFHMKNPICGDSVSVQIELNKSGVITGIHHKSIGCSISTASSSVMSELLTGKTVSEAKQLVQAYVNMVKGEPYNKKLDLGDAIVFGGISEYPARFKCATVSWEVVLNALNELSKPKENRSWKRILTKPMTLLATISLVLKPM